MYNRCMVIALITSIALNVLLIALLFLQRVKATITTQAMSDLLDRVAKLEKFVKHSQGRITVVQQGSAHGADLESTDK